MAKIYGEAGSLENLLTLLTKEGVSFLSSLDEIILFKQDYENKIDEIKREAEKKLCEEIETMKANVLTMNKDYVNRVEDREKFLLEERSSIAKEIEEIAKKPKNIISMLYYIVKLYRLKRRNGILSIHLEREKKRPFKYLKKKISDENIKIEDLERNYNSVIIKRVDSKASTIIKAKVVLDANHSVFLGAMGEQKAVDELKKLPDEYTVVNNFQLKLDKPIYNKNTRQRIYTIQVDHIVVGPSGVFLIETKNWSHESIGNIDLYSPVEQVKRSGYALFCLLNKSIHKGFLPLFQENWGDRKISTHNIILMVNAKPNKEFQYVKILGLHEICGYITYFKPILNDKEISQILNYLYPDAVKLNK